MQEILTISTTRRQELIDITRQVESAVRRSGTSRGVCFLFAQGATAGIMIQENWDQSVQNDVITLLSRMAPQGVWEHDRQDGNGDAHLKSGLVGPSEHIPIIPESGVAGNNGGKLGLSTWQNIFFCEFDGPRSERHIVITIIPA